MAKLVKLALLSLAVALFVVSSEGTIYAGQCMEFVPILLKGRSTSGYRNVRPVPGPCSCQEALEKAQAHSGSDRWLPSCKADGKWEPKQHDSKGAWCVDSNGNQITEKARDTAATSLHCD
ncbi:uncharacterized protein LOC129601099 [Paramacrobiotus metropolitanus]|uniref:uncharacterized protein LOC129601099 n=1 Tax=Paramacrobiotus metropolitanus TaxID=2943436 RepID=UPI0024459D47|nr:uncharacterized protein LOC129601099 [Paramacrobiotus metropolitanus]